MIRKIILNNTNLYIRIVLFVTFFGHGLVSLGFSPSISLHRNLIESINIFNFNSNYLLNIQACFDIIISLLLIINFRTRFIIYIVVMYLILVSVCALSYYSVTTGSIFGFAECLRRFPWIMFAFFILSDLNNNPKYNYIRIGISFAFISHGFASLGFLGLNQGHIDLASNIISSENASIFITYTGISDTIIGLMLLQSIYTKWISFIGLIWVSFIVYLSYLTAIPDAIFRTGFLLATIYVFLDKRTYQPKLIDYEKY